MIGIVRAELLKAARKRRFWALLVLYLLIGPLYTIVRQPGVLSSLGGGGLGEITASYLAYEHLRLGLLSSLPIRLVCVLLVAFLFVEERQQNMWKVVLAISSRLPVFFAKLLVSYLLIALLTAASGAIAYAVGGTIAALVPGEPTAIRPPRPLLAAYALQWLSSIGYLSFCYAVGWFISSVTLSVVLMFSPSVLEVLANSAAQYLSTRGPQYRPLAEFVQRNLLIGNMSAGNALLGFARDNWPAAAHALVVSAVYALIFSVPTLISFSRRDVN